MKGYQLLIVDDSGCKPEDAAAVEALMRVERPTLDSLTVVQFRQLARRALFTLEFLRKEDPETAAFYEGR